MSQMEYWSGNLVYTGMTLEEFLVNDKMIDENHTNDEEDLIEMFYMNYDESFILLVDRVYEVQAKKFEDTHFCNMTPLDDEHEVLHINMSFYNGGTCLSEMCEESYRHLLDK